MHSYSHSRLLELLSSSYIAILRSYAVITFVIGLVEQLIVARYFTLKYPIALYSMLFAKLRANLVLVAIA